MATKNKQKTTGTLPTKFQHIVIYVKDLVQSHRWYRSVFNLQFSAKNHPDSSAAMKVITQTMHFFSFGYYHHDLALVHRKGITPDNTSLLHYTLRLQDSETIARFTERLDNQNIPYRKGRLLHSAKTPDGLQAVYFEDPNGYWIEVLGK